MDICSEEDPPEVGDERRFAACWWAHDHPGKSVLSEVAQ
jgi:hypothetical protein